MIGILRAPAVKDLCCSFSCGISQSDAYSETWQTSKMKHFATIVGGFCLLTLTIFEKHCIFND